MNESREKFQFPSRGFYLVADKILETDYFLSQLKERSGYYEEFGFIFSAFLSAARSVTFSMQAVMSKYPGFDEWYKPRQQQLKNSNLAKFFVDLRNHSQKVGSIPIYHSGTMKDGHLQYRQEFVATADFRTVPEGDVIAISEKYFEKLLGIIGELYRDFDVYVNPRAIFTEKGLQSLNWTIEDLEESLGFPRGWTDIDWNGEDKNTHRLRLLSKHGGDEKLEYFFEKYSVGGTSTQPREKNQ